MLVEDILVVAAVVLVLMVEILFHIEGYFVEVMDIKFYLQVLQLHKAIGGLNPSTNL